VFIATLIAKERLADGDISAAEDSLAAAGVHAFGRSWIEEDVACDLLFSLAPGDARAALEGLLPGVDVIVQGEAGRRKLRTGSAGRGKSRPARTAGYKRPTHQDAVTLSAGPSRHAALAG
jgi:hypothetical protein